MRMSRLGSRDLARNSLLNWSEWMSPLATWKRRSSFRGMVSAHFGMFSNASLVGANRVNLPVI